MNFSAVSKIIPDGLASKLGRSGLITKKHSPTILFAAGVIGVVTTVVLASRATLQLEAVLEDHEKSIQKADFALSLDRSDFTDQTYAKAVLHARSKVAVEIAKLYLPSLAVGFVAVAALTGSHVILNRRNFALTAAYTAMDKAFRQYRERVIEDLGDDKDAEYRHGFDLETVSEKTAEGVVTHKQVKMRADKLSMYSRVFEKGSSTSWNPNPGYNQMFINAQQNYANDKLRHNGHLFLNEVYDMLGLARSREGAIVGWVRGNGDDFVDLGIFKGNMFMGEEFVNGNENSIVLDFNVDGIVYDLI
jgi:hypothetical protein